MTGNDDKGDDKTVLVTFSPPDEWSFTPRVTSMRGAGKVRLEQPSGATWEFVSAEVVNGGTQFEATGNGRRLTIKNKHTRLGTYDYVVTVVQGKSEYTSPVQQAGSGGAGAAPLTAVDGQPLAPRVPQIVNEP